jgi:hypothetical protein
MTDLATRDPRDLNEEDLMTIPGRQYRFGCCRIWTTAHERP